MSAGEDRSPPLRDWAANPHVVRARALLARGRSRAAVGEAWKAASVAVNTDDERGYAAVRELAREIEEQTSGRRQKQAAVLGRYVEHCSDASASGARQGSLLARLFGVGKPPRTKTCPACAERVKAQARICRFCGHTFPEG